MVNRNQPVGCKASTEVGNVGDLWGMYAAGKKEEINEPRGERPVGCKARTGSTTGDPWGQVQSSKKKRGQAGTAGWLGSQSGVDNMGPSGRSTGSRWSTTCSGLKKGGRQMEPYGNRGRKHNLSYENPLLPYFGGPVKTGTRGTGGGRSE